MSCSNEKLRTLAVRAVRAVEDNKGAHPVIAEFEPVLLPLAAKFSEAFDAHRNFTPTRVDRMGNRHEKCSELHRHMRAWAGAIRLAIPSYDANKFLGGPTNPDPLLDDARRLITLLDDHGEKLVGRGNFIIALTERLAAAKAERSASLDTLKQHQALEAALAPLHNELLRTISALRETLRVVVGVGHVDFQALRIRTRRKQKPTTDAITMSPLPVPTPNNMNEQRDARAA